VFPPVIKSSTSNAMPFVRLAANASSPIRSRAARVNALDCRKRSTTCALILALVVWRLDRFGRSLKDLVAKVEELKGREVGFRSLQESIDTTSSTGKLIFHIFGALAEFGRDLVRERTMAGLASARARGRKGGRPRSMDASKIKLATRLMKDPELSVEEICEAVGVSSATLYRYVAPDGTVRKP
jgi:DNA invertase Pin-like site-specific DNA recombinase